MDVERRDARRERKNRKRKSGEIRGARLFLLRSPLVVSRWSSTLAIAKLSTLKFASREQRFPPLRADIVTDTRSVSREHFFRSEKTFYLPRDDTAASRRQRDSRRGSNDGLGIAPRLDQLDVSRKTFDAAVCQNVANSSLVVQETRGVAEFSVRRGKCNVSRGTNKNTT